MLDDADMRTLRIQQIELTMSSHYENMKNTVGVQEDIDAAKNPVIPVS